MSETARQSLKPIALGNDEGEALWFFGALVTIKASSETTGGRVAVIEHLASQGVASPMHVHHNEDEWFYITEGAVTFWVGGKIAQHPLQRSSASKSSARPAFPIDLELSSAQTSSSILDVSSANRKLSHLSVNQELCTCKSCLLGLLSIAQSSPPVS